VRDHLGAEVADLLALQSEVDDAVRPVRQVDYGAAERLVERRVGVSEAGQAGGRAEGAREGVPQGDADVFGCVVVVDWKGDKYVRVVWCCKVGRRGLD
jgi:hypothetical protein